MSKSLTYNIINRQYSISNPSDKSLQYQQISGNTVVNNVQYSTMSLLEMFNSDVNINRILKIEFISNPFLQLLHYPEYNYALYIGSYKIETQNGNYILSKYVEDNDNYEFIKTSNKFENVIKDINILDTLMETDGHIDLQMLNPDTQEELGCESEEEESIFNSLIVYLKPAVEMSLSRFYETYGTVGEDFLNACNKIIGARLTGDDIFKFSPVPISSSTYDPITIGNNYFAIGLGYEGSGGSTLNTWKIEKSISGGNFAITSINTEYCMGQSWSSFLNCFNNNISSIILNDIQRTGILFIPHCNTEQTLNAYKEQLTLILSL